VNAIQGAIERSRAAPRHESEMQMLREFRFTASRTP